MRKLIVFILIIILLIYYFFSKKYDNFNVNLKYPYNPKIDTPESNYKDIVNKINYQNEYKKDLSVALSPIPTIQCDKLFNKESCNNYGCNWFNKFCSSMYPSYF